MAIIKSNVICLHVGTIDEYPILINSCDYQPYLTLEQALKIKEKIDATIEFAKNNDVDALNIAYNDSVISEMSEYSPTKSYKEKTSSNKTYIYLMIDNSNGYYKIGRSIKPKKRERTLQSEKPTIDLLFYWSSYLIVETELHEYFADKRIRGEWFNLTDEDIQYIKSIAGNNIITPI